VLFSFQTNPRNRLYPPIFAERVWTQARTLKRLV